MKKHSLILLVFWIMMLSWCTWDNTKSFKSESNLSTWENFQYVEDYKKIKWKAENSVELNDKYVEDFENIENEIGDF